MKKKKIVLILCITLAVCLTVGLVARVLWANHHPVLTHVTVSSERLPAAFDGFTIAHVSDLHNDTFGKENERLLTLIRDASPDVIALTGDIFDSRHTNLSIAVDFVEQAQKIAPCYYVTGNHEARDPEKDRFVKQLKKIGVIVLENEASSYVIGEDEIVFCGIFDTSGKRGEPEARTKKALSEIERDEEKYTLLLAHRPEVFSEYVAFGADLVLSGHVHGGQVRLPLVGGIYGPGQGLFPAYDAGVYEEENTTLIISRGLGNGTFFPRINNRPEVVLVCLECA